MCSVKRPFVVLAFVLILGMVAAPACSRGVQDHPGQQGGSGTAEEHSNTPVVTKPAPIPTADLLIQGISLDMPLAEVEKTLGTPSHRGSTGVGDEFLNYDVLGLAVYYNFQTGLVSGWSMGPTSKLQTARGIRIGSSKDDVLAVYGAPTRTEKQGELLYYVLSSDPDLKLGVELLDGRVYRIAVSGSPFLW